MKTRARIAKTRRQVQVRPWLTLALLAAACSDGGGSSAGGTGPVTPGAPGQQPPGAEGPCNTTTAFFSPLRRLTRREYNNTIRDLLGDDSAPADRFPPDEVSGGFGNNAAVLGVSPLLAEKYQEAAEALAASAVKKLPTLVGCDAARTGEEACARQFIERFGARAYRRPLTGAERDRLLAVYGAGRTGGSFAEGIEVTLRAILQAPSFLYRLEYGQAAKAGEKLVRLTGHEAASRLSYFLWGTMPDERLFQAAERDALGTAMATAAMARQMLDDPRARPGVVEFHRQWLGLTALDRLSKDARVYPEFTPALVATMRAETAALIEEVVFAGDGTLGALLTPAAPRAGLLTQPGLLAVHALPDQSSPVHRGKLVREQILCQEMPPQPPSLMVSPPEVDPRRPTRERFAQHAADPACSLCHRLMDPIGFGFEGYDGIGRVRTSDGGRQVDDRGELVETRDADGPFRGAGELVGRLGASAEVRDCVATQWYRFAFGRMDGPGDACSLRALRAAFASTGGNVRELLIALVTTEAFLHRPALPGEGTP